MMNSENGEKRTPLQRAQPSASTSHKAKINPPTHPRQTPNQRPRLDRLHQRIVHKADQRPQLPPGKDEGPKVLPRQLQRLVPVRALESRHREDEGEGIERGTDGLVKHEFDGGVGNVELGLDEFMGSLLSVELFLVVCRGGFDCGFGGLDGLAGEDGLEELLPDEVGWAVESCEEDELGHGNPVNGVR